MRRASRPQQDAYRRPPAGPTRSTRSQQPRPRRRALRRRQTQRSAWRRIRACSESALAKTDTDVRLRSRSKASDCHTKRGWARRTLRAEALPRARQQRHHIRCFSALGLCTSSMRAVSGFRRRRARAPGRQGLYSRRRSTRSSKRRERPTRHQASCRKPRVSSWRPSIDPSAVPPAPSKGGLTPAQLQQLSKSAEDKGGGGSGLSKEKLEELMRQLRQQQPQPAPSGAPAGKP